MMSWLNDLLWGNSVAHSVLVLSVVIAAGIALGKIKIFGVSLGIALVLFVGIAVSHFGARIDHATLHFLKEFGLILFVYSVGLQVGPTFFSSFKKGGIQLNLLAATVVLLGVATTVVIHFVSQIPMSTMVGIMSGAVTNTPGLGAAQDTYTDLHGIVAPTIALGYAVAYPLGVIGIIASIIFIRFVFRIDVANEVLALETEGAAKAQKVHAVTMLVSKPGAFNHSIEELAKLIACKFVISRICHANGHIEVASPQTRLQSGDKVLVVTTPQEVNTIANSLGSLIDMTADDWNKLDKTLESRRILISQSSVNGKTIGQLMLNSSYGVNITRVNRSGIDLIARDNLALQIGDRIMVVGATEALIRVEKMLGNQTRSLREPHLATIFIGIALGVLIGSIPWTIPGIPVPIKLGLAGGPLIVAILISAFGPKFRMTTYTTMSANLMLREVGICLFLACVGLGAGENFIETLVHGGGIRWIGLGVIITMLPLLVVGVVAPLVFKINYLTLMGLMAGSSTDPPALAYANSAAGNDTPAVSYATVFPLTLFLRVLSAQLLILLFG